MSLARDIIAGLRLPPADRRLVGRAAAALLAVAVRLRVFGQIPPARGTDRTVGTPLRPDAALRARRMEWAVDAAGRRLGRLSTCLTRALAAQQLARHEGIYLDVVVGVAVADRSLEAHAWVRGGRDDAPPRYERHAPLAIFPAR